MMVPTHAGHIGTKLDEIETAGTNAAVALDVIHQQSKETVSEPYTSSPASILTEFDKTVSIHEANNQISTLIQPAFPTLNVCDRRFLCRMAKKLGCQFCAKESIAVSALIGVPGIN